MHHHRTVLLCAAAIALAGCGNNANLPKSASWGPKPELPAPQQSLIPVNNTAKVVPWTNGEMPTPAAGLTVTKFAADFDHPRWIYVLPNGDVLVAESNKGTSWADTMGYGGWVESLYRRIGGLSTKSANRITLLRDTNGDGIPDVRTTFISGLNSPI